MDIPETRYALSGDVSIAYQVVGEGPFDLVWTPGAVSNVELGWEESAQARFRHALASFARLILFDKRGTGLSDRVTGIADLETRTDDIRAVMDSAGSERAAVAGVSEGGPMAILFAATYPERTQALVLYGSLPRFVRGPGFPWQPSKQEYLAGAADLARTWGSEEYAREILEFDGEEATPERIGAMASYWRQSASPGAVLQLRRMNAEIDVRAVLEAVQVPTAVIHRQEDHLPIEGGRWMASQIPGAKMIELPGGPHVPFFGDWESLVAAIRDFVEPVCTAGVREEHESVLATVLFTDIVGSTVKAAELGDRGWRELLEQHHARIRRELAEYPASSSTPRATASSRASTGRRGRSVARAPSARACTGSGSTFVQGCTPENASSSTTRWRASPCRSARASRIRRVQARFSSPRLCATS